jgi:hypothetical protein
MRSLSKGIGSANLPRQLGALSMPFRRCFMLHMGGITHRSAAGARAARAAGPLQREVQVSRFAAGFIFHPSSSPSIR